MLLPLNYLLAVDIGNSNIKMALFLKDQSTYSFCVAFPTYLKNTQEYFSQIDHFLDMNKIVKDCISDIYLSNVIPHMKKIFGSILEQYFGCGVFCIAIQDIHLKSSYKTPEKIGIDRMLSALYAVHIFQDTNIIVVSCGSALTIDAIDETGEFLGGIIFPGPHIVSSSLDNLKQLHSVSLIKIDQIIGKNTEECLCAGLFLGYQSLLQGLIRKMQQQLNQNCILVYTGGLSDYFFPLDVDNLSCVKIDNLVLHGMQILYLQSSTDQRFQR